MLIAFICLAVIFFPLYIFQKMLRTSPRISFKKNVIAYFIYIFMAERSNQSLSEVLFFLSAKKKKPKLLNKFEKTIKMEIDAAEKLRKKVVWCCPLYKPVQDF